MRVARCSAGACEFTGAGVQRPADREAGERPVLRIIPHSKATVIIGLFVNLVTESIERFIRSNAFASSYNGYLHVAN